MLTIGTMPILLKIVGKIDIKPIIPILKNLDIFEEPKDGEDAKDTLKNLSKEKIGALAFEVLSEITPQLGKIADDLPPLVAAYKGVSVAEAEKLDAAEVINELINDEGVITFFQACLAEKSRAKNLTLLHKYYDWQLIESLPLTALGELLSFAYDEENKAEKIRA